MILAAALAGAGALAASAGSALGWHLVGGGSVSGSAPASPVGWIAYSRAAVAKFAARVPAATGKAAGIDFAREALLAVVGEFGCQDGRVGVQSIVQSGSALKVGLVERPLAAGTVECQALFPTYRLLTVAKAQLMRPLPSRVEVRLARA